MLQYKLNLSLKAFFIKSITTFPGRLATYAILILYTMTPEIVENKAGQSEIVDKAHVPYVTISRYFRSEIDKAHVHAVTSVT